MRVGFEIGMTSTWWCSLLYHKPHPVLCFGLSDSHSPHLEGGTLPSHRRAQRMNMIDLPCDLCVIRPGFLDRTFRAYVSRRCSLIPIKQNTHPNMAARPEDGPKKVRLVKITTAKPVMQAELAIPYSSPSWFLRKIVLENEVECLSWM